MTDPFQQRFEEPATAKRLILSVMAATGEQVSTSQLTRFGALFDFEPAAIRVALGRLVKNGDVVTVARGVHALGEKGRPLLEALGRWVMLPELTKPWQGGWLLVHTAHLGRTQRAALRRRERALALFGFAAFEAGLWIRPDNLAADVTVVRERLTGLGLEGNALVVATGELLHDNADRAPELWDRCALEAGYHSALTAMGECLHRLDQETLEWRVRQTAQIGLAVLAMLTFDPLLPADLVDAGARDAVYAQMREFDQVGHRALEEYWAQTDRASVAPGAPSHVAK